MTRKKVKLAFITNDSARKATYKKRKKGLLKKVSELSTLCGIDACAIIYSPYEAQPEVWPELRQAQRVVSQFKRMPEMEQSKKMVNQEMFIHSRISKAAEQLKKLHKDNREKEMTQLMYQCLMGKGLQGLGMGDLNDMGWLLDLNLKDICKRIEELKKRSVVVEEAAEMGGGGGGGGKRGQQWFTEWMGNIPVDNQRQIGNHGGGGGGEMIMGFNDGINNHPGIMWSSVFFP